MMHRILRRQKHNRLFSSLNGNGPHDGKPLVSDRGAEAKGAMQQFIQKQTQANGKNSLWDRLKKDIAPPIVSTSSNETRNRNNINNNRERSFNDGPKRGTNQRNGAFNKRNAGSNSGGSNSGGGGVKGGSFRGSGGDDSFDYGESNHRGGRRKDEYEDESADTIGENETEEEFEERKMRSLNSWESRDLYEDVEELDDESFWKQMAKEELEEGEFDMESVTPEFQEVLMDMSNIEKAARGGYELEDEDDEDPIDALITRAFIGTLKTSDGSYIEACRGDVDRVKFPRPRNMKQMLYDMQLNVSDVDPESSGYALAAHAWPFVGKNFYMTYEEKVRLVTYLAEAHNNSLAYAQKEHVAYINKYEDAKARPATPGYDRVFHYQFRKGEDYMDEEAHQRAMSIDIYAEDHVVKQEPTDWSVEAVVDEDQL